MNVGRVVERGNGFTYVIDVGRQPRQRCVVCGHKTWVRVQRFTRCEKCNGALVEEEARRQVTKGGFPNKGAARAAMNKLQDAISSGAYVENRPTTVAEYLADVWLPGARASLKATTVANYSMLIRLHVVPHIGTMQLTALTGEHLDALYARLLTEGKASRSEQGRATGLSPASVRRVHAVLHRAFAAAVRNRRLVYNPADAANPPMSKDELRRRPEPWTPAELQMFLTITSADRLHPLWHFLAHTGARRGEALGLRWVDLDLLRGVARIRQARIAVGYEVHVTSPKSGRERTVPLDAGTVEVLLRWRDRQDAERAYVGAGYVDSGLVFTDEAGAGLHPDRVSKLWVEAVKASPCRPVRLHDLRHAHATHMLNDGVPALVVQHRLGHHSAAFTSDTYGHRDDAAQAAAAALFAERLAAACEHPVSIEGADEAETCAPGGIRTPDLLIRSQPKNVQPGPDGDDESAEPAQ